MSDGVKYMLRSKNWLRLVFIGTNGIQSHPPTYADRLLMKFMTQTVIYTMVLTKVTVGVVLD